MYEGLGYLRHISLTPSLPTYYSSPAFTLKALRIENTQVKLCELKEKIYIKKTNIKNGVIITYNPEI